MSRSSDRLLDRPRATLLAAVLVAGACGGGTNHPFSPAGSAGTGNEAGSGGGEPTATGGSGPASTGGSGPASTGGSGPSSTGGSGGSPGTTGGSGGSAGAAGTGGSGGTSGDDGGAAPDAAPADDAGGGTGGPTGTGVFAGMTKLFDGTTLNGWEQGTPMLWSVVDGTLDGKGTTNGALLITKDDYADFRFIFSARMVANNGKGHLGVCFWGGHNPPGKYNNCMLLIPPGGGSWDYAKGGGLPGITKTPAAATAKFDVMQWHQSEILCHQATGTCRMATDGIDLLTYKEPNPARLKKGPIGVQIHAGTSEVQYKDVYVDPMPADDNLRTVKTP